MALFKYLSVALFVALGFGVGSVRAQSLEPVTIYINIPPEANVVEVACEKESGEPCVLLCVDPNVTEVLTGEDKSVRACNDWVALPLNTVKDNVDQDLDQALLNVAPEFGEEPDTFDPDQFDNTETTDNTEDTSDQTPNNASGN